MGRAGRAPAPTVLRRLRGDETQEEVAHRAELTVSGYAKIERGVTSPTWDTLLPIAAAHGLTMAELAAEVERERAR